MPQALCMILETHIFEDFHSLSPFCREPTQTPCVTGVGTDQYIFAGLGLPAHYIEVLLKLIAVRTIGIGFELECEISSMRVYFFHGSGPT